FTRMSPRAFSWRSIRSWNVIGLAWSFRDCRLEMPGGRGLQPREDPSADAKLESAAPLTAVVADCNKRRRESMTNSLIRERTLSHAPWGSMLVGQRMSGPQVQKKTPPLRAALLAGNQS